MITENVDIVAHHLKVGGIVAFPTETVWGLGANAFDHLACQNIYTIKGRPLDNPLILHMESLGSIEKYAFIDRSVLKKLERWIPGPLTVILKKKEQSLFSCGLKTIAVRVPCHPSISLMEKCGFPIAAPSANLSGKPSLTRIGDVVEMFEKKIACIFKGPDPIHGIESTVIDLTGEIPIYVRPGVVSFEELKQQFPTLQKWSGGPLISPGIRYKHYSPDGHVVVIPDFKNLQLEANSGQIGFDLITGAHLSHCVKDNVQYAKELYAFFVECDKLRLEKVYCQIPKEGVLYQAILHRLEKAAYK